jgi:hypothetical protein
VTPSGTVDGAVSLCTLDVAEPSMTSTGRALPRPVASSTASVSSRWERQAASEQPSEQRRRAHVKLMRTNACRLISSSGASANTTHVLAHTSRLQRVRHPARSQLGSRGRHGQHVSTGSCDEGKDDLRYLSGARDASRTPVAVTHALNVRGAASVRDRSRLHAASAWSTARAAGCRARRPAAASARGGFHQ